MGYFLFMLPIVLDAAKFGIVVVGVGAAAERRLALLAEAGADRVRVFATPPDATELASARLVFIADRTAPYAAAVAAQARAGGALVHIEDDPASTDFHLPAVLRRGDLAIAVSTGGGSPTLAVRLKRALGELFGPEWQGRTAEIARLRRGWRAEGADAASLNRRTEEWIDRQRWLPEPSSRS